MIDVLSSSTAAPLSLEQEQGEATGECYDCIILNTDDIEELTNIVEVGYKSVCMAQCCATPFSMFCFIATREGFYSTTHINIISHTNDSLFPTHFNHTQNSHMHSSYPPL